MWEGKGSGDWHWLEVRGGKERAHIIWRSGFLGPKPMDIRYITERSDISLFLNQKTREAVGA